MNNVDFFLNLKKRCVFCNEYTGECVCPLEGKTKLIFSIGEKILKKKKWITTVYGQIDKKDFKTLKDKIGTGGNHFQDKIQLRGCVAMRVKNLLKEMDYEIC